MMKTKKTAIHYVLCLLFVVVHLIVNTTSTIHAQPTPTYILPPSTTLPCERCYVGEGTEIPFSSVTCISIPLRGMGNDTSCKVTICYRKRICRGIQDIKLERIERPPCLEGIDNFLLYSLVKAELWYDEDPFDILPNSNNDTIGVRVYSKCCWKERKDTNLVTQLEVTSIVPCDSSDCCITSIERLFYDYDRSNCCHFVGYGVEVRGGCPGCTQTSGLNEACFFICSETGYKSSDSPASRVMNCGKIRTLK